MMLRDHEDGILASTSYRQNQTRDTTHNVVDFTTANGEYSSVSCVNRFIRVVHSVGGVDTTLRVALVDFYHHCAPFSDLDICESIYRVRVKAEQKHTFTHFDFVVDVQAISTNLAVV